MSPCVTLYCKSFRYFSWVPRVISEHEWIPFPVDGLCICCWVSASDVPTLQECPHFALEAFKMPLWPITIWTKICLFLALYLSLSLSVKHTHTLISYNTVQWKTITNQSPSACGSAVMYILLSLVKLVKSWLSLIANTLSPLLSLSFSPPNFSSTSQRCVREGPQAIVGSKQRISLMLG